MDEIHARQEIWSRMRDFAGWTGYRGETPLPTRSLPSGDELEKYQDAMASFVRERFPAVLESDPGAWRRGGYKRVELDEAFSILGLEGIESRGLLE